MDQSAGENERLIAESVAQLATAHGGPAAMRASREQPLSGDAATWRAFVDAGWLALMVPESKGGAGLGARELAVLAEQTGRELLLAPVASAIVAAHVLSRLGGAAGERMEELRDGRRIWLPAWSGTDPWPSDEAHALNAAETSAGVVLNGSVLRVPDGHWADGYLLELRCADRVRTVLLRRDTHGLRQSHSRTVDGSALTDLVCTDALVEPDDVFDSPVEGQTAMHQGFRAMRLGVAAELVGLMDRALSLTADYLKVRRQFGRPIGAFQAMQQRAASAYVDVQASRALVREACVAADGDRGEVAAAAAKARASEAALRVTKTAIQCHGAIGFADEHDIGLFHRRALVLSGRFGNACWQRRAYLKSRGIGRDVGREVRWIS